MKTLKKYKKIKIGVNANNENIYLTPPEWSCGHYWSFGWIGNGNLHTHLDTVITNYDINSIDLYFKEFIIKRGDFYEFMELVKTIYHFKKHSEVVNRGGSFLTSNPCKDLLINKEYYNQINQKILPALFDAFYQLIYENQKNESHYKKIASFMLEGDTNKTVSYLFENNLNPDDLILKKCEKTYKKYFIHGIISGDWDVIHSLYYKTLHAKK